MGSVFSKIVNGEIPCYKIAETDKFLAFLDINPLKEGHTLIIPKKETDYIFDIDDPEYSELFSFAKKIAKAVKKVIPCKKIGVAVIGLEVPHAHIHLIPIDGIFDIDFSKEKLKLSNDRFVELVHLIRSEL